MSTCDRNPNGRQISDSAGIASTLFLAHFSLSDWLRSTSPSSFVGCQACEEGRASSVDSGAEGSYTIRCWVVLGGKIRALLTDNLPSRLEGGEL